MSKGSSPAGNTTTTTTSPVQQAQTPFLTSLWQQAEGMNGSIPFDAFAQALPALYGGLNDYGTSGYDASAGPALGLQPSAINGANSLINGGNPATPQVGQIDNAGNQLFSLAQQLAQGGYNTGSAQNTLLGLGQGGAQGALSPYEQSLMANPALSSLSAEANGAYLNSNPYIAGEYNAAAQPVVNSYMTATAPQTASNFEAAGRYGAGAAGNAQSINQQNLGTTLGNLASNLYGQDYANERSLQTQAGADLGSIYNTAAGTAGSLALGGVNSALNAANAAGTLGINQANSQINALGGYGNQYANAGSLNVSGLNPELQAINLSPTLSSLPSSDLNTALSGLWGPLNEESALLGNPVGGSSTTTQPYFEPSTLSQILGTGLGAVGLYNGLSNSGLLGGIGSLLGSGGGYAALLGGL